MQSPYQRTLINLAVVSACCMLGAAQAQEAAAVQAADAPAPQEAVAPATQQDVAQAPQMQAAPAPANAPNTVVVSGSRIAARGFTQPTPTTSLSSDDLAKNAQPNLFNTIAELPALQGSTGRTTSTNSTSSGVRA